MLTINPENLLNNKTTTGIIGKLIWLICWHEICCCANSSSGSLHKIMIYIEHVNIFDMHTIHTHSRTCMIQLGVWIEGQTVKSTMNGTNMPNFNWQWHTHMEGSLDNSISMKQTNTCADLYFGFGLSKSIFGWLQLENSKLFFFYICASINSRSFVCTENLKHSVRCPLRNCWKLRLLLLFRTLLSPTSAPHSQSLPLPTTTTTTICTVFPTTEWSPSSKSIHSLLQFIASAIYNVCRLIIANKRQVSKLVPRHIISHHIMLLYGRH